MKKWFERIYWLLTEKHKEDKVASPTRRCLVQEGRRQEAEGRREESLLYKLFNFFQLVTYFRHACTSSPSPCPLLDRTRSVFGSLRAVDWRYAGTLSC